MSKVVIDMAMIPKVISTDSMALNRPWKNFFIPLALPYSLNPEIMVHPQPLDYPFGLRVFIDLTRGT
jgi:hypothetical protein